MQLSVGGVRLSIVVFLLCLSWCPSAWCQDELEVTVVARNPGDPTEVELAVDLTSDQPIEAFSFGLVYDTLDLDAVSAVVQPVFDFLDVDPVELDVSIVDLDGTITVDAILEDVFDTTIQLQESTGLRILVVTFDVDASAPTGVLLDVSLDDVGAISVEFLDDTATTVVPTTIDGGIVNLATPDTFTLANELFLIGTDDNTLGRIDPDTAAPTVLGTTELDSEPSNITVTPDGVTWISFPSVDEVGRYEPDGTEIELLDSGPSPRAIASDRIGNVWVGCAGEVWKYAPAGEVLFGTDGLLGDAFVFESEGDIHAMATDGDGNAWGLVDVGGSDGTLFKLSGVNTPESQGFFEVEIIIDPITDANDIAVDPSGVVWYTVDNRVERRRSDGRFIEEFVFDDADTPASIVIRGTDEAWVTETSSGAVYRLEPGTVPELFFEVDDPTGLVISGDGFVFVTDAGRVYVLDPDDTPPITSPAGESLADFSPAFKGDASGYALANALTPGLDFDGDDVSNRDEIDSGSNPFVADDSPVILPVTDLTCGLEDGETTLTWTNPETYARIDILRDGVVIETIDPEETSYTDEGLEDGSYLYAVTGENSDGDVSVERSCRVQIGVGSILINDLPSEFQGMIPNDVAFVVEDSFGINFQGVVPPVVMFVLYPNGTILGINGMGQTVLQFQSPCSNVSGIAYIPFGNSGNGSLMLGRTNSTLDICEINLTGGLLDNHDPDPLDAPIEAMAFIQTDVADGILFASAPDTCEVFAYCYDPFDFKGRFEHPGGAAGSGSGLAAIAAGIGSCSSPINLTGGSPGGPRPTVVALSVFDKADAIYKIRYYEVDFDTDTVTESVAFDPIEVFAPTDDDNGFNGFDIGQDDVFGNDAGRKSAYVFGATTGTGYAVDAGGPPPTNSFIRGDGDGNGLLFPIVDAVFILEYAFTGGPAPACLDSADVDGNNELFGIIDVLYLLAYGFTGGPAPPDPGVTCGPDPEGDNDGITCDTPSTGC